MSDGHEKNKEDQEKDKKKKWASKGGRARANTLTPEERKEIAKKAVMARWEKAGKLKPLVPQVIGTPPPVAENSTPSLPYATFSGKLNLGLEVDCYVLNDLRRVISQRGIVSILGGGRESGDLQRYLQNNPLIINDSVAGHAINFKIPGLPTAAMGYDATVLIEICSKYLEAREQNLLKSNQKEIAKRCEIVIRATAKLGIVALIDEATGYQEVRAKNALQLKLQAFIAEELQEWAQMFPAEFWIELARLESIHYSPRNRPLRWGRYIMMFVYDAIDSDIGKWLRKNNPDPHFKKNHHQWLKDFGKEKVNNQIQRVIAIMKLCRNMEDFKQKFAKVFAKGPVQLSFDDAFSEMTEQ
ncbi:MAG: P63C domain-containing protein [Endomicrobiales bacterium]